MHHPRHGGILTFTFLVVAGATSPQKASPQVVEITSPRLGGAFMRAFGGDGWGGTVALTHGLFSGAIPLGGLGVDLTWAGNGSCFPGADQEPVGGPGMSQRARSRSTTAPRSSRAPPTHAAA